MEIYVAQFLVFIMLFARITALIVVAPMFGNQTIPVQIKVALGLFMAFVMYPITVGATPVISAELIPLVLMVVKEVIVGLVLGFAMTLLFAGVRFGGELISLDIGLTMASMFDPETSVQASVISEFMYLVMLMVFLMINGHHFVLEALQLSYAAVPIGAFTVNGEVTQLLVRFVGHAFVIAVKIAAPIMVAMFLINIALSILARVMPQMNIFMLAFPVKIGAGFFAIVTAAPLLVLVFKKLLAEFESNILQLVKAF